MSRLNPLCLLAVAIAVGVPTWHQVPFSYQIRCARLDSDSSGWASGTAGSRLSGFFRYDGADWDLYDTIRDQLIYDLAFAGDTCWAVGEQFNFPDGVIYRFDGTSWQQQSDPFDRTLQAVSFPCDTLGFAGGASPSSHLPVLKYRNGTWAFDSSLVTSRIILGMGLVSPEAGFAVGDSGAIFRRDGGNWRAVSSPTTDNLIRVRMTGPSSAWAISSRGGILRCQDDSWYTVPSPTSRRLYDLSLAGPEQAWAVGDSGTILHWSGDTWRCDEFVPSPERTPLFAVTFPSASEGWAFGYDFMGSPVALHYYDDSTGVADGDARTGAAVSTATLLRGSGSLRILTAGDTRVLIVDRSGRVVRRLDCRSPIVEWDGRTESGARAPAGCYLVCSGYVRFPAVILP